METREDRRRPAGFSGQAPSDPLAARILAVLLIGAAVSYPAGFVTPPAHAQSGTDETGRLAVRTFSPKEYGGDPYVWYAAQGNGGLMYFANLDGVLEFDGRTWRTIRAGNTVIRSVASDSAGTVFVGSRNDFGYLRSDSIGTLTYVSLRDRIPDSIREFGDVWQLLATSRGIYFNTPTHVFRWSLQHERLQTWEGDFHKAFAVRDTVYVRDWQRGLVRLVENDLSPVSGGERFADVAVTAMLPYDERRILLATASGDLFLYDGDDFSAFRTEADEYLRKHRPWYYAFARLPDGSFALGTRDGGVVVLDHTGRILQIADRTTGLRSDRVYYIHVDHQNGIWLTHPDGISRWEPQKSISYFDETDGLEGIVEAVVRRAGELYAATSSGVFRLEPAPQPGRPARFVRVSDDPVQCWDFAADARRLLAACTDGVHEILDGRMELVAATESPAFSLHASARRAGEFFVGLKDGLARLQMVSDRPPFMERLDGVRVEARSFVDAGEGMLWVGGSNAALLVDPGNPSDRVVRRIGREQGFAPGYVEVAQLGNDVLFVAENGVWCLSQTQFMPHGRAEAPGGSPELIRVDGSANGACPAGGALPEGRRVRGLAPLSDEEVWLRTAEVPVLMRRDDSASAGWSSMPLSVLDGWDPFTIYPEPSGTVWFGGAGGLVRYDRTADLSQDQPFDAFVRRVATIRTDSLLFGGTAPGAGRHIILPFAENALRFSVGAATFDRRPDGLPDRQFQFQLDGFDADWSRWTDEIHKDYTNLPEGEYTFRVQARGAHGGLSRAASVGFAVLPPWYRTWWAYGLYGLLALGFVIGSARWRMASLERTNRRLEAQVAERSAQLARQKEELEFANARLAEHEMELTTRNEALEDQKAKLQELDAVKTRFFANISHEFRTPLTLILGPLQDALSGDDATDGEALGRHVKPMHANAVRLLGLINQLLDLAQFDAGKMELRVQRVDLTARLRTTISAFSSQAERKGIELDLESPRDSVYAYVDADKIERVVANLLANAFKFTPSGGSIQVRCEQDDARKEVLIAVRDTGKGIAPDSLSRIFDRFYTHEPSPLRGNEGVGIGLALAAEIVQGHGGTIDVDSEPGAGTCFTIRLPLGAAPVDASEPADGQDDAADVTVLAIAERALLDESTKQAAVITLRSDGRDDRPCVLIVEDHADLRAYLRGHLSRQYRVAEADDGEDGLERARELRPDLVISDVMMPRMDGFALCKAIKSDPELNHIPVVLLTARASEADRIEGLEHGADDYLLKPFNRVELLVRAENLIEIRRLMRRRFEKTVVSVEVSEADVEPEDAAFLDAATKAVEAHIADGNFGVDWLASEVDLSVRQLQRRLKDLTGLTPSGFIRSIRLERAAQLLERGSGSVADVAAAVGFSDPKYFSRLFRQIFETVPSEYGSDTG